MQKGSGMDVNERIAALEAELAKLKEEVHSSDDADGTTRRHLFKKAGIAAAGAVAGGAALAVAGATPAFAVHQPEDLGLGLANTTAGLTRADCTGSGGTGYLFQAGSVYTNSS